MGDMLLTRFKEWFGRILGMHRSVSVPAIYEQVWTALQANDGNAYLVDVYADNDNSLFAVASRDGKLWKAAISTQEGDIVLGAWTEVEMQYVPRSRLTISRQADGSYRWFAVTETAVLLRVGELDSTALFDDMIRNAETYGYPKLLFYHDPRLEIGQADWLARENWCYLASGTLLDNELGRALAATQEEWGTSNGFEATEPPEQWEVSDGVTIPVYKAGIHREISVLPESNAASWFTNIAVVTEVTRMRPEVKQALARLLGDEKLADEIEERVDGTNREIERQGMITRTSKTGEQAPVADSQETPETEQPNSAKNEQPNSAEAKNTEPRPEHELVLDDTVIQVIAERIGLTQVVNEWNEKVNTLAQQFQELGTKVEANINAQRQEADSRLSKLEQSEEERQKQWRSDIPARNRTVVTYRPREDPQAETDILDVPLSERAKQAIEKAKVKHT